MVSDQLLELLRALSESSRAAKMKWKESGTRMFDTPAATAILRIEQLLQINPFEAPGYCLSLFRENSLLDSATDEDFSGKLAGSYNALANLYATARAKALGVNDIVSDILSETDVQEL